MSIRLIIKFTGVWISCLIPLLTEAADFEFRHHYIARDLPANKRGSGGYGCTAVVDIDRDGRLDFVLGGRVVAPSRLHWFQFVSPDRWVQHLVGTDYLQGVGLAALDVDGDG